MQLVRHEGRTSPEVPGLNCALEGAEGIWIAPILFPSLIPALCVDGLLPPRDLGHKKAVALGVTADRLNSVL